MLIVCSRYFFSMTMLNFVKLPPCCLFGVLEEIYWYPLPIRGPSISLMSTHSSLHFLSNSWFAFSDFSHEVFSICKCQCQAKRNFSGKWENPNFLRKWIIFPMASIWIKIGARYTVCSSLCNILKEILICFGFFFCIKFWRINTEKLCQLVFEGKWYPR